MTLPAFLFGLVLAALLGAGFHFVMGDPLRKMVLFILLAEAGFWAGHALGASQGWDFALIGPLQAGGGALGSILFLFVGRWLSQVEINQKKNK